MSIIQNTKLNTLIHTSMGFLKLMENSLDASYKITDSINEDFTSFGTNLSENTNFNDFIDLKNMFLNLLSSVRDNLATTLNTCQNKSIELNALYEDIIDNNNDTNIIFKEFNNLINDLHDLNQIREIQILLPETMIEFSEYIENLKDKDQKDKLNVDLENISAYINYLAKTYEIFNSSLFVLEELIKQNNNTNE